MTSDDSDSEIRPNSLEKTLEALDKMGVSRLPDALILSSAVKRRLGKDLRDEATKRGCRLIDDPLHLLGIPYYLADTKEEAYALAKDLQAKGE